jgi:Bacterial antitoxin of type II TA system, VapB
MSGVLNLLISQEGVVPLYPLKTPVVSPTSATNIGCWQGSRAFGIATTPYMIIRMRTTLIIDDDLLRRAKLQATERNQTVSDVVDNALREYLGRPVCAAPPFSLITYGRSSKRVRHEPFDLHATLEQEDRDRLRQ